MFSLTLSHVGIYVTDMARMVDFYTRFLGFAIADRGPAPNGEIVFLTRDSREHHQLVLISGRPADLPFKNLLRADADLPPDPFDALEMLPAAATQK